MRLLRAGAAVVVTAGAVLGLTACSGSSGADASASPAPAATETSAAATPGPDAGAASPSPSPVATLPVTRCLSGTYALVRFVAVGSETYGTGQGGDVTVSFGDDRYTLTGGGAKPVVVTIGGQTGDLTVDGQVKGTYRLKDDTATFTQTSASGSGTLGAVGGGGGQKVTMQQVAKVIGLSGDGKVACTDQAMTITLPAVRLELGRV